MINQKLSEKWYNSSNAYKRAVKPAVLAKFAMDFESDTVINLHGNKLTKSSSGINRLNQNGDSTVLFSFPGSDSCYRLVKGNGTDTLAAQAIYPSYIWAIREVWPNKSIYQENEATFFDMATSSWSDFKKNARLLTGKLNMNKPILDEISSLITQRTEIVKDWNSSGKITWFQKRKLMKLAFQINTLITDLRRELAICENHVFNIAPVFDISKQ